MAEEFIGNYKVIQKIGAGGMAKVYLAVHKDVPNLKVVLKILSDNRLIDRFRQEADKMALLDGHGNICQIKHFFNHGDDLVIAMEYIHGETIEELIEKRGRLPIKETVEIVIKTLETLQFAHNKKIFHRDIKPSNVMIDKSGNIKIIDFGIAKAEDDPDLTMAGSACGTPAYMAPEQFTPSVRTNYALIDIYAVGTMLFHMLTGELPFKGENQFVLRDAKLFNDPAKPRQFNKDIPKKLENIVLKALDKDYHERYQSADEMRQELLDYMESSGYDTQHPTYDDITEVTDSKSRKELATRPKGRGPIYIGTIAVLLAVAVYMIFFRGGGPSVPEPPALLSPANNAELEKLPALAWEGTAGENGQYELQIATSAVFDSVVYNTKADNSPVVPDKEFPPGQYSWRVRGVSAGGNPGEFSATRQFTIIAPKGPVEPAHLELTIDPSGDVYIDGNKAASGVDRYRGELLPGQHEVRVVNKNSREKAISREINARSGEAIPLKINFTALPPKPEYGQVRVGTKPPAEAEVYIDGEKQALKTPNTYRLEIGSHEVRITLELDGRQIDKTESVVIKVNEIAKLIFDLQK